MRNKLLLFLLLFSINAVAQSESDITIKSTDGGYAKWMASYADGDKDKTVMLIRSGDDGKNYCFDAEGNSIALPKAKDAEGNDIDYWMKFRKLTDPSGDTPGTVAVWSHPGMQGQERFHNAPEPYAELVYGTNLGTAYKGTLVIPSQIKWADPSTSDEPKNYNVVQVDVAAFYSCKGITDIQADCKYLQTIRKFAFVANPLYDSYTAVNIKTEAKLTVERSAFENYNKPNVSENDKDNGKNHGNINGTDTYSDYFNVDRTGYLKTVDITAAGMDLKPSAFLFNPGLQKVTLTSTSNEQTIDIGDLCFALDMITPRVYTGNAADGSDEDGDTGWRELQYKYQQFMYGRPLAAMYSDDRKTSDDGVYINGRVGTIGIRAFCGHVNFQRVEIKDLTENPTYDGMTIHTQAFQHCFNGKNSVGKVHIEGPVKEIGGYAFALSKSVLKPTSLHYKDFIPEGQTYSSSLTEVYIKNTGTDTLFISNSNGIDRNGTTYSRLARGAFFDHFGYDPGVNEAPATITITGPIGTIGAGSFDQDVDRYYLTTYPGGNTGMRVRSIKINNTDDTKGGMKINRAAFRYAMYSPNVTDLSQDDKTLTITGSIKSINEEAFSVNTHAKNVTIKNTGNTAMSIGKEAFFRSMGFISPTSAYFDDGTLTIEGGLASIGYRCFEQNKGMKTFELTTNTDFTIGENAFWSNINLETMNYKLTAEDSEWRTNTLHEKATAVGKEAFYNCAFTEITIPKLTLKGGAATITVNGGSTDTNNDEYNINQRFASRVFSTNKSLEKVTIANASTGRNTFFNCQKLEKAVLKEGVKNIEHEVFENCTKLHELDIPESAEVIGHDIIINCNEIRVNFAGKQPPYAMKSAFASSRPHIVVPRGSVSSYLFVTEDLGFQNVWQDNISCTDTIPASKWGSLGMIPHTVKKYEATFSAADATANLEALTTTNATNEITTTDIYDTRRIGMSDETFPWETIQRHRNAEIESQINTLLNDITSLGATAASSYSELNELLEDIITGGGTVDSDVAEALEAAVTSPTEAAWLALAEKIKEKYGESDVKYAKAKAIYDNFVSALSKQAEVEELKKRLEEGFFSPVKVYTADYYYKEFGKVGLDEITNYAVVPQSTSTTDRNIGYLVNGEPGIYYLHHYNGGTMTHKLTTYDYDAVFAEAKTCFDSEDILKPGALRNGANDTSYSRTDAPNLLVAWDESHTGYAQGTMFKVGGSFGDTPCNYYGYDPATDKFRRLSATTWAKMKEGIAFLVVPTSLLGSDGTGSGKATLGVFINGEDDNDNGTTGIKVNVDGNGNGNVDCWYTLQGVRLSGKPTVSGIYIHNGRKEAVK